MGDAELRILLLVATGGLFGLWVLSSFITRVSGTWLRAVEDGAAPERLTLQSLGPFVGGEFLDAQIERTGGRREVSGFIVGRTLYLSRRDHGAAFLEAQGFPAEIAAQRDGKTNGKLRLTLKDGVELDGTFTPLKVEFTHQPPRVTAEIQLAPTPRNYRRIQAVPDGERLLDGVAEEA